MYLKAIRKWRRLLADKRGISGLVGTMVTLVAFGFIILISVVLMDSVRDVATDVSLSTSANETYEAVEASIWNALDLAQIIPIIIIATAIIGILFTAFAIRRSGGD